VYAASKNVAVMVMEPLRGGMLAGNLPKDVEAIYEKAGEDRSAASWALRWVWDHPEVTVVLSGMNDENHIAENIRTCEDALPGRMSDGEKDVLARVASCYQRLMKVGCTGCGYCMPCPAGVNIPQCFSLYNTYYMGGSRLFVRGMYGLSLMGVFTGQRADASRCRECGKCQKACPQKIPIMHELKSVNRILGGLRTKMLMPVARIMFSRKVKE
jgi:uncharacterized protein